MISPFDFPVESYQFLSIRFYLILVYFTTGREQGTSTARKITSECPTSRMTRERDFAVKVLHLYSDVVFAQLGT